MAFIPKLYSVDLTEEEVSYILCLTPHLHPLAIKLRQELRLRASLLAEVARQKDRMRELRLFIESGGQVQYLPPQPDPKSKRKHKTTNGKTQRKGAAVTQAKKLLASMSDEERDNFIKALNANKGN